MYSQFMQIPQKLQLNSFLPLEENKEVEFKGIQETKKPVEAIQRYLKDYLNAFLNSQGGSIWFGIEDNCLIRGVFFTQKERDEVRQIVDVLCNQYVPQVDASITKVDFIPVYMKVEDIDATKYKPINVVDNMTYQVETIHSQIQLDKVVSVASILMGQSPVYFTSKTHETAFMRRDGGIVKMSPDVVVQRITNGRYQQNKDDLDDCSLLGRKEIIKNCLSFLSSNTPTRVLVLYGLISVGKSKIAEYLRQKLVSDRHLFPIVPQIYQLDMHGSLDKHISLNQALIQLIKSIKPDQELILEEEEPSVSTTQTQPQSQNFLSQLGSLSFFTQDFDTPKITGAKYSKQTQSLLNIYQNLINQNQFTLLCLENVGKPQIAARLIPQGANCCVICTCRKSSNMDLMLGGPAVKFFELNIPPLSDSEGALIVLRELPQTDFTEAQNISRLCSGLPQVIRILCSNCKQYGVEPRQLILKLQSISAETRLKQLSPQLFSLISQLQQEQLFTLGKLSLYPGLFSDDAACAVLGNTKIERVFSDSGDAFGQICQLGLVDKVLPPCQGLRAQVWWKIADAIRDHCFKMVERCTVMNILDRFMIYQTQLAQQLNQQLEIFNSLESKLESTPFKKQVQASQVYELFLTSTPNFELFFKMCSQFQKDPRPTVRGKGNSRGLAMIQLLQSFTKQFRPSLAFLYDQVSEQCSRGAKIENKDLDELDLDWAIWCSLYV